MEGSNGHAGPTQASPIVEPLMEIGRGQDGKIVMNISSPEFAMGDAVILMHQLIQQFLPRFDFSRKSAIELAKGPLPPLKEVIRGR